MHASRLRLLSCLVLSAALVLPIQAQQVERLTDIHPDEGHATSFVGTGGEINYVVYDGRLYFPADDGTSGMELWRYDGTQAVPVADLNPSGGSYPIRLTVFGGQLYFVADDGTHGRELYRYDGTAVARAADIWPGNESSNPSGLTVYAGALYFAAETGEKIGGRYGTPIGRELYRYDGTSVEQVANIHPGMGAAYDSNPGDFTVYDGVLYFRAATPSFGAELWAYDGTSAYRVSDINPSVDPYGRGGSSSPRDLIVYDGHLYFTADDGTHGRELWRYDGTGEPVLVQNVNPGPADGFATTTRPAAVFNGKLFFAATDGVAGEELWSYDGTVMRRETNIGPDEDDSGPAFLTVMDDQLYFSAVGPFPAGRELWRYDGATAALAADVNPAWPGGHPRYLTVYDGALYFAANDDTLGFELWRYTPPAAPPANRPPAITLLDGDTEGTVGDVFAFTAAASDPDGDPLTYAWDFGDGSPPPSGEGLTGVEHTYADAGTFTLTLSVVDGRGGSDTETLAVSVVVPNRPPVLTLLTGTTAALTGESFHFTAEAADPDGDPLTYTWDFGDGSPSQQGGGLSEVEHVYTIGGTYTLTVDVEDGDGGADTGTLEVHVWSGGCRSNGTGGGYWMDASTWIDCGGTVPDEGDDVTISPGDTVHVRFVDPTVAGLHVAYDSATASAGTLHIQGGGPERSVTVLEAFQVDGVLDLSHWSGTHGIAPHYGAAATLRLSGTSYNRSLDTPPFFHPIQDLIVEETAVLPVNASLTVRGNLRIDGAMWFQTAGSYHGFTCAGCTVSYGSAGSLRLGGSVLEVVDDRDAWWPATSGPQRVDVYPGGVQLDAPRSVAVVNVFGSLCNAVNLDVTLDLVIQDNGVVHDGPCVPDMPAVSPLASGKQAAAGPTYAPGATLVYATGGVYSRGDEWDDTTPHHVRVDTTTTLDLSTVPVDAVLAGDLTIGAGATVTMGGMPDDLIVGGDLYVEGTFVPSDGGGQLIVQGETFVGPQGELPVELVSFEATRDGDAVRLTWQTATETNNAGFEVERAAGAGAFARIGFVEGAGTTAAPQAYRFTDEALPFGAERVRYRLRQVDYDGAFAYSPVVEVERTAPETYALHGAYPNPFNPQTTLRYELAEAGPVRLTVYDALGREVAVLVDSEQTARRHAVRFDAHDLPSGVYFYRLEAAHFRQTRRMLLLR